MQTSSSREEPRKVINNYYNGDIFPTISISEASSDEDEERSLSLMGENEIRTVSSSVVHRLTDAGFKGSNATNARRKSSASSLSSGCHLTTLPELEVRLVIINTVNSA